MDYVHLCFNVAGIYYDDEDADSSYIDTDNNDNDGDMRFIQLFKNLLA